MCFLKWSTEDEHIEAILNPFSRNLHWSWKLRIYVNYSFFFSLYFHFPSWLFPPTISPLPPPLHSQFIWHCKFFLCIFVLNKKNINCISFFFCSYLFLCFLFYVFYERQFRTSLRFNWWSRMVEVSSAWVRRIKWECYQKNIEFESN